MGTEAVLPQSVLSGLAPGVRIVVLGRAGCHLCDAAHDVVRSVAEPLGVGFVVLDIDEHGSQRGDVHGGQGSDLVTTFGDQIPVTFIDGRRHAFWRVDADRLRAALA